MTPDRYEPRVIENAETITASGVIENAETITPSGVIEDGDTIITSEEIEDGDDGNVLRGNGDNHLLFSAVDLDERASDFRMKAYKQAMLGFVVVLFGIGSGMATVL